MFWQNLESDDDCSSLLTMAPVYRHQPVMVPEVLEYLACRPGRNYLDLTLGGGGHAEEILKATAPDGKLIGSDRDLEALSRASTRLASYKNRVITVHNSIGRVDETLEAMGDVALNGVLIDCGVSSNQLEEAERGFSFTRPGPLDMRMDPSQDLTAKQWLSRISEEDLANAIFEFGEERHSRRIARAIVQSRKKGELQTTSDLAEVVRRAVPSGARFGKIHPATRTFQAIRIVVNDELNQLRKGLTFLIDHLPHSCRLVVITFHSLEDRIVKELFRAADQEQKAHILTKKPIPASDEEVRENPRSRSAKIRAIEMVGGNA